MTPTSSDTTHVNRLIRTASPYLLQHAHNPVDWRPWDSEAIAEARRDDKPIFLSIGYSACHWCHVMARESFEDEQTAALMNKYFINVKVDREERPDLDELYMRATVIYSRGVGGWPMSVWLTPDLKPFAAGTYFPPEDRHGRPGFRAVCERIHDAWTSRRKEVEESAEMLSRVVSRSLSTTADGDVALGLDDVDRAVDEMASAFDPHDGGLLSGPANKFPPCLALELMLRVAARTEDTARAEHLLAAVTLTLDKMADGGIRDHLAGGFARYSTDPQWRVPHFEKMLYDQALVSRAYLAASLLTGGQHYADMARETFEYVLADLQAPDGGFYSARDADSEGQEGKYYVWTKREVVDILGADDSRLFCDYYNLTDAGNWSDPHDPDVSKNVLYVSRPVEDVASAHDASPEQATELLAQARAKLLAARQKRTPPGRDTKVLCEWNGLMISSLAQGGAALGEPRYVAAAAHAANFILNKQLDKGSLRRSYRDGATLDVAFLSDYACLIEGLLDLYEATFERRWLDQADTLNARAIELFWDEPAGGFFFTPQGHETLPARAKEVADGVVPCGNSVQLSNLLRLAALLGRDDLRDKAERTINVFAARVRENSGAADRFLAAVDFARCDTRAVVIAGDPSQPDAQALLRAVRQTYQPNRVVLLAGPAPATRPYSPLLNQREPMDGRATAYVCVGETCLAPTNDAEELAKQMR